MHWNKWENRGKTCDHSLGAARWYRNQLSRESFAEACTVAGASRLICFWHRATVLFADVGTVYTQRDSHLLSIYISHLSVCLLPYKWLVGTVFTCQQGVSDL